VRLWVLTVCNADKKYIHDVVKGPNDVDPFLYKNYPKQLKTGKLHNGGKWIFNKKCWKLSLQTILIIQGGDGGMECMCILMLGNGTLEFMVQQHMSWVTLVSAYFSFK
jgi:hypothetical protein